MTEQRTALFDTHVAAGAKMVPFAGWSMPLHYGSQVKEHEIVRTGCGLFDVSHMTVIDVTGAGATEFLQHLLAADCASLAVGAAQYGVMLNPQGGIIDDLITYRRAGDYRLVTNAGTRDRVIPWINAQQAQFDGDCQINERASMGMIAVQGPAAIDVFERALGVSVADLAGFSFLEDGANMIARTGYTGEDGVEIILPGSDATQVWQSLVANGASPAGLGARDTLRCEAGLNLYGQDMTEDNHPLESALGWTLDWEPATRDFVGRAALSEIRGAGVAKKLTGIMLAGRGVLRHDYVVHTAAGEGVVTSGIHSPSLGFSVGLARVPRQAKGDVEVEIRGKRVAAKLVKAPFVRHGEPQGAAARRT